MDRSNLNTTFDAIEHNEPGKLPSYTLTQDGKPFGQSRIVATIDGKDASDKTWAEFEAAIEQGRDVVFEYTKTAPASE